MIALDGERVIYFLFCHFWRHWSPNSSGERFASHYDIFDCRGSKRKGLCVAKVYTRNVKQALGASLPNVAKSDTGLPWPSVTKSDTGLPSVTKNDTGLPSVTKILLNSKLILSMRSTLLSLNSQRVSRGRSK